MLLVWCFYLSVFIIGTLLYCSHQFPTLQSNSDTWATFIPLWGVLTLLTPSLWTDTLWWVTFARSHLLLYVLIHAETPSCQPLAWLLTVAYHCFLFFYLISPTTSCVLAILIPLVTIAGTSGWVRKFNWLPLLFLDFGRDVTCLQWNKLWWFKEKEKSFIMVYVGNGYIVNREWI